MESKAPPSLLSNARIHIGFMPDAAALNHQILETYFSLQEQDFVRRSHHFHGRYENLYLERERIPGIACVLAQAEYYAQSILTPDTPKLRSDFWINDMGPGAITTEHNHDEDDELLSAVYYIQAPQDAGDLVIVEPHSRTLIAPQAGMMVFFAPSIMHSVGLNRSQQQRISIGMNFGPAPKFT